VQIGVVSFGLSGCVRESVGFVFTRVTHYVPWIEQTIAAHAAGK